MRGCSWIVLFMLALSGCGKKAATARDAAPPIAATPPPPADAGRVWRDDASIVRGPSSYLIVRDDVTVAVAIVLPVGWHDLSTEDGVVLETERGSRFEIVVDAAGTVDCKVEVVADEAALRAEMAQQCATLRSEKVPDDRVSWTVTVKPAKVTLADVGTVLIEIAVTNRTDATLAPARDPLEVSIDGEPSMGLSNAFGNGGRGREWRELAPGATARDSRRANGVIDSPGDHLIVISRHGVEHARTTLHVTR